MTEPIAHFYSKFGFDRSLIRQMASGGKYLAIMLTNGNIGVCSTLHKQIDITITDLNPVDTGKIPHRILLTAYYNALLNYSNSYPGPSDIFNVIRFSQYRKIVMIGYFESLLQKFKKEKIEISAFDRIVSGPGISPQNGQMEGIQIADAIILTATSVYNQTFMDIVNHSPADCKIFILGPSTTLHRDMFQYPNIQVLFGSLFKPYDTRPLHVIGQGKGTRDFIPFMKKVYLRDR